jgi:heat shock protein HslJ
MRRTAALALLALAACAPAPKSALNRLVGSEWRFVTIDGAAPVSANAKLQFREDSLGANVGCNGMGGNWRIEGGRLIAGPLVQTEMYCEGPVWGQEQAVSALLVAAPEVTFTQESLVLRSSGHRAELARIAPAAR